MISVTTYPLAIRRLMVCSLTIVISRAVTSPLLALFISTQLGLNQNDVGLLMGIAAFIGTFLGLYGGYVVDRLEKRRLLILSMLSGAIGFLLLTFANDLHVAALALIITESASALFVIGSKAILSDNLPVEQRAKAFSLRYTLTNIGYATGPMLGVILAGVQPMAPFWTASAIAFLSIFLMKGVPTSKRSDAAATLQPPSFLATLATLRGDRILILFTLGSLLNAVVHGRFTIYLSQYLLVEYSSDDAMSILSAVLACNAITVIVLQYQFGRLLKREHLAFWMGIGSVLFISGLLGFMYAENSVSWCIAMFVFTLGEMIVLPGEYLFIDTIAPEHLRGSYYGAQNLAALGGALSPILCGFFLTYSAPTSMFLVLMAFSALGGLLCFETVRRGTRRLSAEVGVVR